MRRTIILCVAKENRTEKKGHVLLHSKVSNISAPLNNRIYLGGRLIEALLG